MPVRATFAAASKRGIAGGLSPAFRSSRSLRFSAAGTKQAKFTPGSAGTRTIGTLRTWFKPSVVAAAQTFISAYVDGSNSARIALNSSYQLRVEFIIAGTTYAWVSNQVFRDPMGHGEIVVNWNTVTQALNAEYNGAAITWASSATLPSSGNTAFGYNGQHTIGADWNGSAYSNYFSGYLSETVLVIGTAYPASTFGKAPNFAGIGEWDPKAFSITYGAQGGYWKYADNSSTANLGTDSSGNGNTLTMTNFSVTAGVTNDSLRDVPTNWGTDSGAGGEVGGNYATWNPLLNRGMTLTEGNLRASANSGAAYKQVMATMPVPDKTYFEVTVPTTAANSLTVGVTSDPIASFETTNYPGQSSYEWIYYFNSGQGYNNGSATSAFSTLVTAGDVLMCAIDPSAGKLWFGKNGTWFGSGAPASGTNAFYSGLPAALFFATGCQANAGSTPCDGQVNFGQRAFAYAAPTGFKALCTQNMSNTTVALPATFAGNASADGPAVPANGVITAVTINGNVATRGTHFDSIAGGIKLRTSSSSYNASGSNTVTAYTAGTALKYARGQAN